MDENRVLLDQLMGIDRTGDLLETNEVLRIDDPDVCKNYLCGFCLPELFANTKSALEPCLKKHDHFLQQEYQQMLALGKTTEYGYEFDFLQELEALVKVRDRKVKQIKERIGEDKDQPDALTLKVCEECGGIMVSNDSEDRIQSHLQGKHHLGFVRICETIKELKMVNLKPAKREAGGSDES